MSQDQDPDRGFSILHWFISLIAWDGILPLMVLLAPTAIRWLFPGMVVMRNQMNLIEIASLVIPVAAFLARFVWGVTIIRGRGAPWRYLPFLLGLTILAIGECLYILIKDNPGAMQEQREVFTITLAIWCVYLLLMAIAFFPTRSLKLQDTP